MTRNAVRDQDIAEAFDASGEAYAASAPDLIQISAAAIVERLPLKPGDLFVDLGCGPGTLIACAEPALGRRGAIGIDLSRAQIEIARERFRSSPVRPRFIQESAVNAGLPSRSAAAVGLGLTLPYSESPLQLLREATRLTRVGGRVAATVLGSPFFGAPGTRLLGVMERRGVAPPEVELQFDPRHFVQLALRSEVEDARLDDVVIEEIERELWWDDFDAWWRMLQAWAFLPAGRPVMLRAIRDELRTDDRVVDPDGVVRCRIKLWLLSATVKEGDPWL